MAGAVYTPFSADTTATRSMISDWHATVVCQSVCLPVSPPVVRLSMINQ